MTKNSVCFTNEHSFIETSICKEIAQKKDGKTEVVCMYGRIDVVTKDSIIEVKKAINWKNAIGQIIVYSKDLYYKNHQKEIYLFDHSYMNNEDKETIRKVMKTVGIKVTFYGNVYKYVKVKVEKKTLIFKRNLNPVFTKQDLMMILNYFGIDEIPNDPVVIKREKLVELYNYPSLPSMLKPFNVSKHEKVVLKHHESREMQKLLNIVLKKWALSFIGKRKRKRVNGKQVYITPYIRKKRLMLSVGKRKGKRVNGKRTQNSPYILHFK